MNTDRKPGLAQRIFNSIDQEIDTARQGDFGDARDGTPVNRNDSKPMSSKFIQTVKDILSDIDAVISGNDLQDL